MVVSGGHMRTQRAAPSEPSTPATCSRAPASPGASEARVGSGEGGGRGGVSLSSTTLPSVVVKASSVWVAGRSARPDTRQFLARRTWSLTVTQSCCSSSTDSGPAPARLARLPTLALGVMAARGVAATASPALWTHTDTAPDSWSRKRAGSGPEEAAHSPTSPALARSKLI